MILVDSEISLVWNLVSQSGQGINRAVAIAKASQVAVVVVGTDTQTCGEGLDVADLDLPGNQLALIQAVQATGTPTIVVLLNGR